MRSIHAIVFPLLLAGNILAQGDASSAFDSALLARDLATARKLLPQLDRRGDARELAVAATAAPKKRMAAMLELAERTENPKIAATALVAGLSAVLEVQGRAWLLGFPPRADDPDTEPAGANHKMHELLLRYARIADSLRDRASPDALSEARWMLRTARVIWIDPDVLRVASGEPIPVPSPLAEAVAYRFVPFPEATEPLTVYRDAGEVRGRAGVLQSRQFGTHVMPPEPGHYVLELRSLATGWTRLRRVLVSDLVLTSQRHPSAVVVMASLRGKPLAGLRVRLCADEVHLTGVTDADGIARIDLTDWTGLGSVFVRAEHDGHTAFCRLWEPKQEWELGQRSHAHVMTDRPIYEPGETVHGRIIVQKSFGDDHGGIRNRPLAKTRFVLVLWPGTRSEVRFPAESDVHGAMTFDYRLPLSAPLGTVPMKLVIARRAHELDGEFEVAAFRRAALLVDVDAPKKIHRDDREVVLHVTGTYASGAPASGLTVEVEGSAGGVGHEVTGRLDERGRLSVPIAVYELPLGWWVHEMSAKVSVQSPEGRTVVRRVDIDIAREHPPSSDEIFDLHVPEDTVAGDTAEIRVSGPPSAAVLLSVVRERILTTQRITLDAKGAGSARVSTSVSDWPAVFATVSLEGRSWRDSSRGARLRLARADGQVALDVRGLESRYRPRDKVRLRLRSATEDGNALPATLSVAVVDERVFDATSLRLTDPRASLLPVTSYPSVRCDWSQAVGNPWAVFGALLDAGAVNTTHGIEFTPRGGHAYAGPGAGRPAPGGIGSGTPGTLRSKFRRTAFFVPRLVTDAHGFADLEFELPDDLTTWRCTIVAVADDGRSALVRKQFVTEKPLSVQAVLPRYLRAGDWLDIPLVTKAGAKVSATADGLELDDVRADSLRLRANNAGSGTLTVAATGGGLEDRAQHSLTVLTDDVLRTTAKSFHLTKPTGVADRVSRPVRSRKLILLGTRDSLLRSAARYLGEYPYGCVEQTCSCLVPVFAATRAQRLIHPGRSVSIAPENARRIEVGMARLRKHLLGPSRGFRWWKERKFDAGMTALALTTLAQARTAGIDPEAYGLVVRPDRGELRGLAEKLLARRGRLRVGDSVIPVENAEAVVAGLRYRPRFDLHKRAVLALLAADQELPSGLLARAGLALWRAGEREAARTALARALRSSAVTGAGYVGFPGETRVTRLAHVLELMIVTGHDPKARADVVTRILSLSRNGRFGSTYSTASAVQALLLDAEQSGTRLGARQPIAVDVEHGGKHRRIVLEPDNNYRVEIPITGPGGVTVSPPNGRSLYAVVSTTVAEPARNHAGWHTPLSVTRTLSRLVHGDRGELQSERVGQDHVQRGDLLRVDISVGSSDELRYVAVSCPLPSGWEVVGRTDEWAIYKDRAVASISRVPPGKPVERSLFLRPGFAGSVGWPPVHAECMYFPRLSGASPGSVIAVGPRRLVGAAGATEPLLSKKCIPVDQPVAATTDVTDHLIDLCNQLERAVAEICVRRGFQNEDRPEVSPRIRELVGELEQAWPHVLDEPVRRLAGAVIALAPLQTVFHGASPGPSLRFVQRELARLRVGGQGALLEQPRSWTEGTRTIVEALEPVSQRSDVRAAILAWGRAALVEPKSEAFEEFCFAVRGIEPWPELVEFLLAGLDDPREKVRDAAFRSLPDDVGARANVAWIKMVVDTGLDDDNTRALLGVGARGHAAILAALERGDVQDASRCAEALGLARMRKLPLAALRSLAGSDLVVRALAESEIDSEQLLTELRRRGGSEWRAALCRALLIRGVAITGLRSDDPFGEWLSTAAAARAGDAGAAKRILGWLDEIELPAGFDELFAFAAASQLTVESFDWYGDLLDDDEAVAVLRRFDEAAWKRLITDDDSIERLPARLVPVLRYELATLALAEDEPRPALAVLLRDRENLAWLQDFMLRECTADAGQSLARLAFELTGASLVYRSGFGERMRFTPGDQVAAAHALFRRAARGLELTDLSEEVVARCRQRVGCVR